MEAIHHQGRGVFGAVAGASGDGFAQSDCDAAWEGTANAIARLLCRWPGVYSFIEKAIEAVKKIRFIPAVKSGKFVATWMQLEYSFNLY